jgi:hypothetical protein
VDVPTVKRREQVRLKTCRLLAAVDALLPVAVVVMVLSLLVGVLWTGWILGWEAYVSQTVSVGYVEVHAAFTWAFCVSCLLALTWAPAHVLAFFLHGKQCLDPEAVEQPPGCRRVYVERPHVLAEVW